MRKLRRFSVAKIGTLFLIDTENCHLSISGYILSLFDGVMNSPQLESDNRFFDNLVSYAAVAAFGIDYYPILSFNMVCET